MSRVNENKLLIDLWQMENIMMCRDFYKIEATVKLKDVNGSSSGINSSYRCSGTFIMLNT